MNRKLVNSELDKYRKRGKGTYTYCEIGCDCNIAVNLLEENQELKKEIEELEFIVGLRQKRNLINKFDKEYDEEDKKKNPNRDYAGIMPDAEEIYKRYYTMKHQQKEYIEYLENEIKSCELTCDLLFNHNKEMKVYKEILQKYKEINHIAEVGKMVGGKE